MGNIKQYYYHRVRCREQEPRFKFPIYKLYPIQFELYHNILAKNIYIMIYDHNNNRNTAIVWLSFFYFFIWLYAFHGTSANTYTYIDSLSSVWESIVTNTFLYNISIIQNLVKIGLELSYFSPIKILISEIYLVSN